jgi:hypothetical protein
VFGKYVVNLALPCLLFNALAQRRIGEVLDPVFLAAYAIGSLVTLLAGVFWARKIAGKRVAEAGVLGMGMACPNSGFIGFPLVAALFGPLNAGTGLALAMLVELFITIPLALAIAEGDLGDAQAGATRGQRWRATLLQSLRGILRNPMIYGIAAGLLFSLAEWRLPAPLARTVDIFAMACASLSLFVIGGSLVGIRMRGLVRDTLAVGIGKLLVHPLAVLAAVLLLPPTARELQIAVVVMAAVPMVGIYPILVQKYGYDTQAAAIQLGTTVASFFTLTLVLWAVKGALGGPGS